MKEVIEKLQAANPELPIKEVSSQLIIKYRGPGTLYIPRDIADSPRIKNQEQVLQVLKIMSQKEFKIVKAHWIFCEEGNDGDWWDLTQEEVDEAYQLNEFYHPENGERIRNFDQRILLHYHPTKEFDEWRKATC